MAVGRKRCRRPAGCGSLTCFPGGGNTTQILSALVILMLSTAIGASSVESSGSPRTKAYIGAIVAPVSFSTQTDNGMRSVDPGIEVIGMDWGSPAEAARLSLGDVITHANGRPLREPGDLDKILAHVEPSAEINLTVMRKMERQDLTLSVADLPKGYLGIGVMPLCDRESARSLLPAELAGVDSLPVVAWLQPQMRELRDAGIDTSSVVVSLQKREIRSVREFQARADSISIGDKVHLRFYAGGKYRDVELLAQSPPRPWSGLRLEEIIPTLVEAESLALGDAGPAGLFVRKVESGSPGEQAGLTERDMIMAFDGREASSVAQFEEWYQGIGLGGSAAISVRRASGGMDTLSLLRSSQLGYLRRERFRSRRYSRSGLANITQSEFVCGAVGASPLPHWTKVTGPRWIGYMGVWTGHRLPELGVHWACSYGSDNERLENSWIVYTGTSWFPKIEYVSGIRAFRNDDISDKLTSYLQALFYGEDPLDYLWQKGWIVTWNLSGPSLRGHSFALTVSSLREEGLPTVSRPSWISGRRKFGPNPVDEITEGLIRAVDLSYTYSRVDWRNWARDILGTGVDVAGGVMGGDMEFVSWGLYGAKAVRVAGRLYFDGDLRLRLAGGDLPVQKEFYVGGQGTLPGYADREYRGNRFVLARARLSLVPVGRPEAHRQVRLFAGVDAGNAWQSKEAFEGPKIHPDVLLGVGYFVCNQQSNAPFGIWTGCARPLERGREDWRFHFSLFGVVF